MLLFDPSGRSLRRTHAAVYRLLESLFGLFSVDGSEGLDTCRVEITTTDRIKALVIQFVTEIIFMNQDISRVKQLGLSIDGKRLTSLLGARVYRMPLALTGFPAIFSTACRL